MARAYTTALVCATIVSAFLATTSADAVWKPLVKEYVCVGSRDAMHATTRVTAGSGRVHMIKLHHVRGAVSCSRVRRNQWTNWGCNKNRPEEIYISVYDDRTDRRMAPNPRIDPLVDVEENYYTREGETATSSVLTLSTSFTVNEDTYLRFVYTEDEANISENDNRGVTCFTVDGLIEEGQRGDDDDEDDDDDHRGHDDKGWDDDDSENGHSGQNKRTGSGSVSIFFTLLMWGCGLGCGVGAGLVAKDRCGWTKRTSKASPSHNNDSLGDAEMAGVPATTSGRINQQYEPVGDYDPVYDVSGNRLQ